MRWQVEITEGALFELETQCGVGILSAEDGRIIYRIVQQRVLVEVVKVTGTHDYRR